MEASLRLLRIVRIAMLASIMMYAYIANQFGPAPKPNQPVLFFIIAGLSVLMITSLFPIRRRIISRQEIVLAAHPEDVDALRRWRTGFLTIYCICEAVVLYGVVLRYIGFTFSQVIPFFLAGFGLMLFFSPKRPSSAIG